MTAQPPPPRVAFKTLGCRLNQAETARMAGVFHEAGYEIAEPGEPCDVVVIHTCAITGVAEAKCIRAARAARRRHPGARIVLAGCAVEVAGERLRREGGADLVVGQRDKFNLPDLLPPPPSPAASAAAPSPTGLSFDRTRALLKVQDGCDFCCAYCIVPAARGAPHSRPIEEILDEARALADAGFVEVVVTGANLGRYENNGRGVTELLERLERIEGLRRIRLSSIELTTAERDVVDFMATSAKVCRFLHVPLQSGDDAILRAMGRRYTADDYRRFVEAAALRLPGLGLGTDIIVGLPGETEAAFQNTASLVNALPFSNLHVFPYSVRSGTRAAAMPGQVAEQEKQRRSAQLRALGAAKRRAFARTFVGKPVDVLIERMTGEDEGTGWTSAYIEARVRKAGVAPNNLVCFTPLDCQDDVLC